MEKKKHHYVPVTYLKGFADDDGFVNVSRKKPCVQTRAKPSETGFRKFYYSQPKPTGGHDNNRLEDMFSALETQWETLSKLLVDGQPANHLLNHLLGFMGFQRLRVPAFRDAIEQAMANFVMRELRAMDQRGELPPPPEGFPDILEKTVATIDPHQSIHAIAKLLRSLGPFFDSLGYTIIRNVTDVEFITSDNPVSYYSTGLPDAAMRPYRVNVARPAELIFPVSPSTLVFGCTKDRERFRGRGLKYVEWRDAARVRRVNRLTARFSYEAVFSRRPLPQAFMRKYADLSPVLDPEFPGFDPDHVSMPPFVFGSRNRLPKWDRNRDYKPSAITPP